MNNEHGVFVTLGASNHTVNPRAEYDYYATDPRKVNQEEFFLTNILQRKYTFQVTGYYVPRMVTLKIPIVRQSHTLGLFGRKVLEGLRYLNGSIRRVKYEHTNSLCIRAALWMDISRIHK